MISAAGRTHGRPAGYNNWAMMKQRCQNPRSPSYYLYGARGISVCVRWEEFENFLADMGSPPSAAHTIERIDTNKNYEPGNCKWATALEQGQNKRNTRLISAFGKTQSTQAWAREVGLDAKALAHRIDIGLSAEQALTLPAKKGRSLTELVRKAA